MKTYQPWLIAVLVGLLLTGCYYLPQDGGTGNLSFMVEARFTNPNPVSTVFRMELYQEEDKVLQENPLPIGADGARFIDVPISSSDVYNGFYGPFTIANIPARRRYVVRVLTWDTSCGSYLGIGPAVSSPFEVLPGQITDVSISFTGH